MNYMASNELRVELEGKKLMLFIANINKLKA